MATRAQRSREETQRLAGQANRKKQKPKPGRKPPAPGRFTHNDAARVEQRSTYAIEETTKPSRKSTRKSSNRAKPDSAIRISARERNLTPRNRTNARSH